jgi:hypothetical protein
VKVEGIPLKSLGRFLARRLEQEYALHELAIFLEETYQFLPKYYDFGISLVDVLL